MVIEDVHIVEPEPAQALVQAGKQVFGAAAVAVGAVPHHVARLAGDDQLVSVGGQTALEHAAEGGFGGAWRWPVVVGEIEVGDPQIERLMHHGLHPGGIAPGTKVVPEPEADAGQAQAVATGGSVSLALVAIRRGEVVIIHVYQGS
ncbi:hypothetical protein D3C81_1046530 [compost metagenome]